MQYRVNHYIPILIRKEASLRNSSNGPDSRGGNVKRYCDEGYIYRGALYLLGIHTNLVWLDTLHYDVGCGQICEKLQHQKRN